MVSAIGISNLQILILSRTRSMTGLSVAWWSAREAMLRRKERAVRAWSAHRHVYVRVPFVFDVIS